ncbi:LCP family protein [Heyndrickxia oleronia]|uniref:LCP family protein n=1 Tax=Heyndrickxia oleronia TaxID=38875 RepID=A0AAW6SR21_9BACI|nr:LCP family protein [Heyndrickxia oleronia]MCM3238386.1 LCP family protein [Heyndrickxia oleronia]MDH5161261.1 LCP family protein [Heyndrickxia oleronia]
MGRQEKSMNKKKKKRKLIAWLVIFPILLLACTFTAYGAHLYKKAEKAVNDSYKEIDGRKGKSEYREAKVDPYTDNISILFIGVDGSDARNYGDATRSDALMLATLNEKEKTVKLLSIPRDSYVYIDDVGYKTKINHAHAYGGIKSTVDTVENLLKIPVDYYVEMNFYAFMEIVDTLDGIEVEVPYKISEIDSNDKKHAIRLDPGLQTLNGEEALALARTRKQDSDIMRGQRQQEIMKAILDKATSVKSATKYSNLIDAIGSNMTTNMTFSEMKSLIEYGLSGHLNIESLTLAGTDSMIDGVYYYQLDDAALEEIKTKLSTHLELKNNVANVDTNNNYDDEENASDSEEENNY